MASRGLLSNREKYLDVASDRFLVVTKSKQGYEIKNISDTSDCLIHTYTSQLCDKIFSIHLCNSSSIQRPLNFVIYPISSWFPSIIYLHMFVPYEKDCIKKCLQMSILSPIVKLGLKLSYKSKRLIIPFVSKYMITVSFDLFSDFLFSAQTNDIPFYSFLLVLSSV